MSDKTLGEVFWSIGDGGIVFEVIDNYGPTLVISSAHFGNNIHRQEIHTDKESLKKLADMLSNISTFEFSEPYSYAARDRTFRIEEHDNRDYGKDVGMVDPTSK